MSGIAGVVSAANSLVGTTAGDVVGGGGRVTVLTNGNYSVSSPNWDNGAARDAGAITWASGATGIVGAVSAENSLVGTSTDDNVGQGGVIPIANGNYLVYTSGWDNGDASQAGAVTWVDGKTPLVGAINALNSAVGLVDYDFASFALDDLHLNGAILVQTRVSDRVFVGSQTSGFTTVRVGSTDWNDDFLDFVDPALHLGYAVPANAAPLPWTNLNQLSVTFTQSLQKAGGGALTADDFSIVSVDQVDYNALVSDFLYDSASHTATFTFISSIETDTLIVSIDAANLQDERGHVQPGIYQFRLDVLPGDADRNGAVTMDDVNSIRQRQGTGTVSGAPEAHYSIFHDLDGSGGIVGTDVGRALLRLGGELPADEPAPPALSATVPAGELPALVTMASSAASPIAPAAQPTGADALQTLAAMAPTTIEPATLPALAATMTADAVRRLPTELGKRLVRPAYRPEPRRASPAAAEQDAIHRSVGPAWLVASSAQATASAVGGRTAKASALDEAFAEALRW
jgi:hypothetical protein